MHEDWGATPAAIDCALAVADEYDVQVSLHADTLNESGYLADTIAAIDGRTIHSYHTEGAGGGHAPDMIAIASLPNVLPSSTNPTRPYTTDTVDNLFYMTVVTHHLNPDNPEDIAFAQSRIRAETQAAEDVLHDMGVLSMYSSDSQAMGRIGDTVATCWRTADKMKKLTGALDGRPRAERQPADPAVSRQADDQPGADARHRPPGGLARAGQGRRHRAVADEHVRSQAEVRHQGRASSRSAMMGDPNASIPTPEPVLLRPMFGGPGQRRRPHVDDVHVSGRAVEAGVAERLGLDRWVEPVRNCRTIGKAQMVRNDATPGDRRRPGDLPGQRRRPAGDRRRRRGGVDVPALLHRLMVAAGAEPGPGGVGLGAASHPLSGLAVCSCS